MSNLFGDLFSAQQQQAANQQAQGNLRVLTDFSAQGFQQQQQRNQAAFQQEQAAARVNETQARQAFAAEQQRVNIASQQARAANERAQTLADLTRKRKQSIIDQTRKEGIDVAKHQQNQAQKDASRALDRLEEEGRDERDRLGREQTERGRSAATIKAREKSILESERHMEGIKLKLAAATDKREADALRRADRKAWLDLAKQRFEHQKNASPSEVDEFDKEHRRQFDRVSSSATNPQSRMEWIQQNAPELLNQLDENGNPPEDAFNQAIRDRARALAEAKIGQTKKDITAAAKNLTAVVTHDPIAAPAPFLSTSPEPVSEQERVLREIAESEEDSGQPPFSVPSSLGGDDFFTPEEQARVTAERRALTPQEALDDGLLAHQRAINEITKIVREEQARLDQAGIVRPEDPLQGDPISPELSETMQRIQAKIIDEEDPKKKEVLRKVAKARLRFEAFDEAREKAIISDRSIVSAARLGQRQAQDRAVEIEIEEPKRKKIIAELAKKAGLLPEAFEFALTNPSTAGPVLRKAGLRGGGPELPVFLRALGTTGFALIDWVEGARLIQAVIDPEGEEFPILDLLLRGRDVKLDGPDTRRITQKLVDSGWTLDLAAAAVAILPKLGARAIKGLTREIVDLGIDARKTLTRAPEAAPFVPPRDPITRETSRVRKAVADAVESGDLTAAEGEKMIQEILAREAPEVAPPKFPDVPTERGNLITVPVGKAPQGGARVPAQTFEEIRSFEEAAKRTTREVIEPTQRKQKALTDLEDIEARTDVLQQQIDTRSPRGGLGFQEDVTLKPKGAPVRAPEPDLTPELRGEDLILAGPRQPPRAEIGSPPRPAIIKKDPIVAKAEKAAIQRAANKKAAAILTDTPGEATELVVKQTVIDDVVQPTPGLPATPVQAPVVRTQQALTGGEPIVEESLRRATSEKTLDAVLDVQAAPGTWDPSIHSFTGGPKTATARSIIEFVPSRGEKASATLQDIMDFNKFKEGARARPGTITGRSVLEAAEALSIKGESNEVIAASMERFLGAGKTTAKGLKGIPLTTKAGKAIREMVRQLRAGGRTAQQVVKTSDDAAKVVTDAIEGAADDFSKMGDKEMGDALNRALPQESTKVQRFLDAMNDFTRGETGPTAVGGFQTGAGIPISGKKAWKVIKAAMDLGVEAPRVIFDAMKRVRNWVIRQTKGTVKATMNLHGQIDYKPHVPDMSLIDLADLTKSKLVRAMGHLTTPSQLFPSVYRVAGRAQRLYESTAGATLRVFDNLIGGRETESIYQWLQGSNVKLNQNDLERAKSVLVTMNSYRGSGSRSIAGFTSTRGGKVSRGRSFRNLAEGKDSLTAFLQSDVAGTMKKRYIHPTFNRIIDHAQKNGDEATSSLIKEWLDFAKGDQTHSLVSAFNTAQVQSTIGFNPGSALRQFPELTISAARLGPINLMASFLQHTPGVALEGVTLGAFKSKSLRKFRKQFFGQAADSPGIRGLFAADNTIKNLENGLSARLWGRLKDTSLRMISYADSMARVTTFNAALRKGARTTDNPLQFAIDEVVRNHGDIGRLDRAFMFQKKWTGGDVTGVFMNHRARQLGNISRMFVEAAQSASSLVPGQKTQIEGMTNLATLFGMTAGATKLLKYGGFDSNFLLDYIPPIANITDAINQLDDWIFEELEEGTGIDLRSPPGPDVVGRDALGVGKDFLKSFQNPAVQLVGHMLGALGKDKDGFRLHKAITRLIPFYGAGKKVQEFIDSSDGVLTEFEKGELTKQFTIWLEDVHDAHPSKESVYRFVNSKERYRKLMGFWTIVDQENFDFNRAVDKWEAIEKRRKDFDQPRHEALTGEEIGRGLRAAAKLNYRWHPGLGQSRVVERVKRLSGEGKASVGPSIPQSEQRLLTTAP